MSTVVSRVIDGDTFDTTSGKRVRLADIDAPESGESGYLEARNSLTSLVYNRLVHLDIDDVFRTDRYGRLVCVVYIDHNTTHVKNVNKALLVAGFVKIWNFNNEFNPNTWTLYSPKEPQQVLQSDTKPPTVTVLSPKNTAYYVDAVPLTFVVNEPLSWIAYRLDYNANKTIVGNTTLYGLSEGTHTIIVYAKDMSLNIGFSGVIQFTIDTQENWLTFPASQLYVVAIATIVIIGIIGAISYRNSRKR